MVNLNWNEVVNIAGISNDHTQNADGSITIATTGFEVAQTWFEYDGAGRLTKTYDPQGKITEYFYNSLNQLTKAISPDKGISEYRYNRYNQLRFERDQNDIEANTTALYNSTQFKYNKYDKWGRIYQSGMRLAILNTTYGAPATAITANMFDDNSLLNDQQFPYPITMLTVRSFSLTFDGTRATFDSDALVAEYKYSNHQLLANYFYNITNEDFKSYTYHPDNLINTITFKMMTLPGEHVIKANYNALRLPIGKEYIHPTNNKYNFKWINKIDNLGRVSTSENLHNNTTKEIVKNFFDPLGNLTVKGLGKTGTPANPYVDYVYSKLDIRDRLINLQSNSLRTAMRYDAKDNMTAQYWSNETFDPTIVPTNVNVNSYTYTYDNSNRLIGADYNDAISTTNPFAFFNSIKDYVPFDFNCYWNIEGGDTPLDKELNILEDNIIKEVDEELSIQAIKVLRILAAEYQKLEISFDKLSLVEQNDFLNNYLKKVKKAKENALSFEFTKAPLERSQEYLKILLEVKTPTIEHLKYTKELLVNIGLKSEKICNPNPSATIYGALPSFDIPASVTTSNKYDAAYWYQKNGNMEVLHRNNNLGVKTTQSYTYGNTANNYLSNVSWTIGGVSQAPTNYTYDKIGNLKTDPKNGVSSILYNPLTEMPESIQNTSGLKKYRYDNANQRTVKDISATDREFYIDDVILNQTGGVKSYQTAEGYAVPIANGTSMQYYYYIKDWQGTVRQVLSETGVVLNSSDHYPYGLRLPARNLVVDGEGNRYQFTGHEFDAETSYEYHGARYYNRELGRYMSVDPLAGKAPGWSPYRYAFDNPINYTDIKGLFETRKEARAYKKEHGIEGRIRKDSDGEGFNVSNKWSGVSYSKGTEWEKNNGYTNKEGVVESTFVLDKKYCGDCLDPSTVGHNLLGLTYPGGNNPMTFDGAPDYSYVPTKLSEYPAIGHDRRYDKLDIKGGAGLFLDTRAIGADYRFVTEEYAIAGNPLANPIDRLAAATLGTLLGLAALPKTMLKLSEPAGALNVSIWYYKSNQGVTNTPSK